MTGHRSIASWRGSPVEEKRRERSGAGEGSLTSVKGGSRRGRCRADREDGIEEEDGGAGHGEETLVSRRRPPLLQFRPIQRVAALY